jgi:hypothetical protein
VHSPALVSPADETSSHLRRKIVKKTVKNTIADVIDVVAVIVRLFCGRR